MTAVVVTLALSVVLCGVYLKLARRLQIVALPNHRSSHALPTPHGGGTALLLACCGGMVAAAYGGVAWQLPYRMLTAIALGLMVVGVLDDLLNLSARLRLLVYAGGVMALVASLMQPVQWPLALGAAFALLWLVNLYNFMDGIDGFAGLQAVLACVAAAILSWFYAADPQYSLFCLLLAAAHLGFLAWNWPPARLFMGDAGSIPTGFLLGGLALVGAVKGSLPLACWLILLATFVTDASVTLVARLLAGARLTEPHREHAYQRLSRHWGSHLAVDMLLLAISTVWLVPLALAASLCPKFAFSLVILAYIPLLGGMAIARKLG